MKLQKTILLTAILFLMLCSCKQRFGYLSKIKADNNKKEIVKKPTPTFNQIAVKGKNKKVIVSEPLLASINNINMANPANNSLHQAQKVLTQNIIKIKATKGNKFVAQKLVKINTLISNKLNKIANNIETKPSSNLPNIDGVKWMIAGLILILAGIVFGIVVPSLGYALSSIGVIVFVIGLIFFLLDYLK